LLYTKSKFTTNRTFDNVFYEERKQVEHRTKFFLEERAWYDQRGIPYTLGFMFHGPPGTGKTSSVKAIANEGRRHIVNVQLSEIKTKAQLQHLFFNDELHVYNGTNTEKYTIPVSERLYVIEDIDAMGDTVLRREWKRPTPAKQTEEELFLGRKEDEKEVIDLSFLLNLLDGTLEANGRILIITTNFPERLDRALVRPGRVDMIVTFKNAKDLQAVAREVPLERMLIETDSPYLAPVPMRGKTNEPGFVRHVAEFLADLKGVSLQTLAEVTSQNFRTLFRV
jgi:SpoVK/Ycf46/Vps4 family AAA+-type ATPase